MGLNLETLIGILVILILLILADGIRRMVRERQGQLRMRIDPRFRDADDIEDEDLNPELGEMRVVQRGESANAGEPIVDSPSAEKASAPPTIMEQEQPAPVVPKVEQQSLFDESVAEPKITAKPDAIEVEPEPQPVVQEKIAQEQATQEPAPAEPVVAAPPVEPAPAPKPVAKPAPQPAPKPAAEKPRATEPQPVLEVIVVHLIARRGAPFHGGELLRMLLESGLRYGKMNIFHRHITVAGEDELQFSMANAVEPGTFDLDSMEDNTFAGVTFFLKLPGPSDALGALDTMLAICRHLAENLDGELKDEQRSVLTQQTMEHLRHRVQECERRLRVQNA